MAQFIALAALLATGSAGDAIAQRSLPDIFDQAMSARFEGWMCMPAGEARSILDQAGRLDARRDAALNRLSAAEAYQSAKARFDDSRGEVFLTNGPCGPGPGKARGRYKMLVRELERRARPSDTARHQ